MKLVEFRVKNYRSVNDSGPILVADRTALVGRNESGKSNILLALQALNPPNGRKPLNAVKDFPRDRMLSECSDSTDVVESRWLLTGDDTEKLSEIYPRAREVEHVSICRRYGTKITVGFEELSLLAVDRDIVRGHIKKIQQSIGASVRTQETAIIEAVNSATESLANALLQYIYLPKSWADLTKKTVTEYHRKLAAVPFAVPDGADAALDALDNLAIDIINDDAQAAAARKWVAEQLPVFVYLSDYAELDGHQSISTFLQRRTNGTATETDRNFEKLCKVAGLKPEELSSLLGQDHEKRQHLANRAGAVVTKKLRDLWTDRELKVRFNLDADHMDTLVSDPTNVYDVEVNLNERSRGLKWFFSFYITFTADTQGGSAENAILLLDEPGLYLHAVAQRDFLKHLRQDFKNQILFTTHSPFMIPVDELHAVRTVNIQQDAGTTVSNDPIGDEKTLFPLQAALGYSTTQALFVGEKNLIVEGVSDYWYLSGASEYLADADGAGLSSDVTITPAGGAQRVSYMVSLLSSHRLRVVTLLDEEPQSRQTAEELIRSKLLKPDGILYVSDGLTSLPPGGADIEDLIDPVVFAMLMEEAYKKDLAGRTLSLNANIPRIAKRYEEALNSIGLRYNKTRPAKLFLKTLSTDPEGVMTEKTKANFLRLFTRIGEKFESQTRRSREPFG